MFTLLSLIKPIHFIADNLFYLAMSLWYNRNFLIFHQSADGYFELFRKEKLLICGQ